MPDPSPVFVTEFADNNIGARGMYDQRCRFLFSSQESLMTKPCFLRTAISAGLLVGASGLASADTLDLIVSATVVNICKFSTTDQTLSLGTIDPDVAGPMNGSGVVKYKCTKGASAASGVSAGGGLNLSGGSRRMGNGAGDFIAYTLAVSGDRQTGQGFGPGTDLGVTITGQIVQADYQRVVAGSYSDTVLLTLAP